MLNTNLRGAFLRLKYEAKAMLAGGNGGAIVNVGSVNSFLGCSSYAAYATSKHGLIGLTTAPVARDYEALALIERRSLMGRGIGSPVYGSIRRSSNALR